jgi:hypothetical protein
MVVPPFLLPDAIMAASYRDGEDSVAGIARAKSVAELRDSSGAFAIYAHDEAVAQLCSGRPLALVPLCGGTAPRLAWPHLERAAAVHREASQ